MGFGILMKKLCWMWGSCEKGAGMQDQDPPTPCKQKQRVLLWSKQLHMLLKEVLISLLNVVENCGKVVYKFTGCYCSVGQMQVYHHY